jgi:hypothetical protein
MVSSYLTSLLTLSLSIMAASGEEIKVGFLGNSIQYFNDSPRLLEQMLQVKFRHVKQDSCLRGGATLTSLWREGNGMQDKFTSKDPHSDIGADTVEEMLSSQWDFIVINDYTQGPARLKTRHMSASSLQALYFPLLAESRATPVFLQTAAYRKPTKGSDDLGSVEDFTKSISEGYQTYAAVLSDLLPESQKPVVAPVGQAFLQVHNTDRKLWEKLFYVDNHHPSPHGTWLQACVLYCVLVGDVPPEYNPQWWKKSRFMMPGVQLEVPNRKDAERLRNIAIEVCGLVDAS